MTSDENENLEELILQKEKELQRISRLRVKQLEQELGVKNQTIEELQGKLLKIQEDFTFNIGLIQERDTELEDLEHKLQSLKAMARQKEVEMSEVRANHAAIEERYQAELKKLKASEKLLIESRDELREQLTSLKFSRENEFSMLKRENHSRIDELEGKIRDLLQETTLEKNCLIEKYEMTLTEKEETSRNLQSRLEDKISAYANEIDNLKNHVQILQRQNNKIDYQSKLNDTEEKYKQKIQEITQEIKTKDELISKLSEQVYSITGEKEAFLQEIQSWEGTKDSLEREIKRLKIAHEEEMNYMKQTAELQSKRTANTYNNQIIRLQEKLKQNEEETERSYMQAKHLREKHLEIETRHSKEIQELEDQHSREMKNSDDSIRSLKSEVWTRDSEINTLNEKLHSLQLKLEFSEKEIQLMKQNAFDSDAEVRRLRHEQVVRKSPQKDSVFEEFPAPSSVHSYHSSNRFEDENRELRGIIARMTQEMEDIHSKIQPDTTEKDREIDKLKQINSKLRNELRRITEERDQLLSISSELKAQLKSAENSPEKIPKRQLPTFDEALAYRKTQPKNSS